MYKIDDYLGKRVSKHLEVIGEDKKFNQNTVNANHWLFRCDCGKIFSEFPSRVLSGHKQSCGCQRYMGNLVHDCCKDEFYHTWWAMMQRCYNKDHHNYARYGARGIVVCNEWHDPQNFITWAHSTVGNKDNLLTLDRIDNNKGYSPQNCRWATIKQQARNRSTTRYETINGETKPLKEWCEIYGIDYSVVITRCNRLGWDIEDAIKTPKQDKNENLIHSRPDIKKVEIDGEVKSISEWAKVYGVRSDRIYRRIRSGMSPYDAIIYTIQNIKCGNFCVKYHGETKSLSEWAKILGKDYKFLYQRIKKGWTPERAFETPVNESKRPFKYRR